MQSCGKVIFSVFLFGGGGDSCTGFQPRLPLCTRLTPLTVGNGATGIRLICLLVYFVDSHLRISTTRPETMLGDTAIAIHPDDTRYSHLHDKFVIHPFTNERLPIICDGYVDMQKGTGENNYSFQICN